MIVGALLVAAGSAVIGYVIGKRTL